MAFYCYIVASRRNGTLYIGSTDSLNTRIWQHKTAELGGFTAKYGCDKLVWYEVHDTREGAFQRERRIKEWRRVWKLALIEEMNPEWRDLYWQACGAAEPGVIQQVIGALPTPTP